MPDIIRTGTLISIGDDIRIETGPRKLVALADKELLGDKTADHYQGPRDATKQEIADPRTLTQDGKRFFLDAVGNPIVEGEDMTYLDWVGFKNGDEESTRFYLYRYVDRDDPDGFDDPKVWAEIGVYETEDAALSAAFEI